MDFITDASGRHILNLDDKLGTPDFVKECAVDEQAVKDLPTHLFADPARREFPLDDAGHVWLGYGYCKSAGVSNPDVLRRLRVTGTQLGISSELDRIDAAFPTMEKKASAPRRFHALAIDFGPGDANAQDPMVKAGGVVSFYPCNDADDVRTSACQLGNDLGRIPDELFVEASRNLVKAAHELRVPVSVLPSLVGYYGADRLPDVDLLEKTAAERAEQTKDDTYTNLVKAYLDSNGDWLPLAEQWKQADTKHNLQGTLKDFTSCYPLFLSGPIREDYERELAKWAAVGETLVPMSQLAAIPMNSIKAHFPAATASQVSEAVKLASTDPVAANAALAALPDAAVRPLVKLVLAQ